MANEHKVADVTNYAEVDVLDPKGIVQVYRDYWWWCVGGDPRRAVFYRHRPGVVGAPQCNQNKAIAEHVGANLGHDGRASLIQIPLAFCPWEG